MVKTIYTIPIIIGEYEYEVGMSEKPYVYGKESLSVCHNHPGHEVQIIVSGSYKSFISDKLYNLKEGDIYVIKPFQYHSHNSCEPNNASCRFSFNISAVNIKRNNSFLNAISIFNFIKEDVIKLPSDTILKLVYSIIEEIKNRDSGYLEIVKNFLSSIIIYLARHEKNKDVDSNQEYSEHKSKKMDRIYNIEQFFYHNYFKSVFLEDLASELKVSSRQANNIMSELFGMSFSRKLEEIRIKNAATLLMFSNKNIKEISSACGFNSINYFYLIFKKQTGVSPSQYRNLNNK